MPKPEDATSHDALDILLTDGAYGGAPDAEGGGDRSKDGGDIPSDGGLIFAGTAILSETPEIYGAEHLLTRRAAPDGTTRCSLRPQGR